MSRALATLSLVGWLLGCQAPPQPTPYRPIANARETMLWILDPAADAIWDAAGFVITEEGEVDLSPTTDEGWKRVHDSAAVVAETGNLLMMPGRSNGPDWVAYSQDLMVAAEAAMAAARARDARALFDAGGDLYVACRACHEQFMVPLLEAGG